MKRLITSGLLLMLLSISTFVNAQSAYEAVQQRIGDCLSNNFKSSTALAVYGVIPLSDRHDSYEYNSVSVTDVSENTSTNCNGNVKVSGTFKGIDSKNSKKTAYKFEASLKRVLDNYVVVYLKSKSEYSSDWEVVYNSCK